MHARTISSRIWFTPAPPCNIPQNHHTLNNPLYKNQIPTLPYHPHKSPLHSPLNALRSFQRGASNYDEPCGRSTYTKVHQLPTLTSDIFAGRISPRGITRKTSRGSLKFARRARNCGRVATSSGGCVCVVRFKESLAEFLWFLLLAGRKEGSFLMVFGVVADGNGLRCFCCGGGHFAKCTVVRVIRGNVREA